MVIQGPISFEFWRAYLENHKHVRTYEFPLYSDTFFLEPAEIAFGPYKIFNSAFPVVNEGLRVRLILRANEYEIASYMPSAKDLKTDTSVYHKGSYQDEIGALCSLCLGVRLKAGSANRIFFPDERDDPKGYPQLISLQAEPVLPTLNKVAGTVAYILPQALVSQRFGNIGEQFERYSIVKPEQAAILIKAARLYQDAIWLVESQPEMSWLLLVSALETAAGYWRATNEYPVDRLRASKPELEKFLLEAGGAELLSTVADQIADYMGATKKFIDFVLNFLPPPPPERPPEGLQHPWDERSMKKSLSTIYNWRSKALHSGIPFPHPMCSPPIRVENGLNEKPIGLGSYAFGGTWVAKDIPMLFHTFEYIARHALLNWWNSLVESI